MTGGNERGEAETNFRRIDDADGRLCSGKCLADVRDVRLARPSHIVVKHPTLHPLSQKRFVRARSVPILRRADGYRSNCLPYRRLAVPRPRSQLTTQYLKTPNLSNLSPAESLGWRLGNQPEIIRVTRTFVPVREAATRRAKMPRGGLSLARCNAIEGSMHAATPAPKDGLPSSLRETQNCRPLASND
jgi:hypothetical protein